MELKILLLLGDITSGVLVSQKTIQDVVPVVMIIIANWRIVTIDDIRVQSGNQGYWSPKLTIEIFQLGLLSI